MNSSILEGDETNQRALGSNHNLNIRENQRISGTVNANHGGKVLKTEGDQAPNNIQNYNAYNKYTSFNNGLR